jgi:hypothetical protein
VAASERRAALRASGADPGAASPWERSVSPSIDAIRSGTGWRPPGVFATLPVSFRTWMGGGVAHGRARVACMGRCRGTGVMFIKTGSVGEGITIAVHRVIADRDRTAEIRNLIRLGWNGITPDNIGSRSRLLKRVRGRPFIAAGAREAPSGRGWGKLTPDAPPLLVTAISSRKESSSPHWGDDYRDGGTTSSDGRSAKSRLRPRRSPRLWERPTTGTSGTTAPRRTVSRAWCSR